MIQRRLAAAAFVAVTMLTTGPALAESPQPILSAVDNNGDVRIRPGRGPDAQQRRSVDIRKLTVEMTGSRVRFTVRIARITSSHLFDQMAFVRLTTVGSDGTSLQGDIGFSPQARPSTYGYAYVTDGETYESIAQCDPLRAVALPRHGSFSLEVPKKCVVPGAVKVSVTTFTGFFRSDAGGTWSRDSLRVPGTYTLVDPSERAS